MRRAGYLHFFFLHSVSLKAGGDIGAAAVKHQPGSVAVCSLQPCCILETRTRLPPALLLAASKTEMPPSYHQAPDRSEEFSRSIGASYSDVEQTRILRLEAGILRLKLRARGLAREAATCPYLPIRSSLKALRPGTETAAPRARSRL